MPKPPTTPAPAPPTDPAAPPADPDDGFVDDRQRQRFHDLTTRLTERETERDAAHARLEALQWAEAERLAAQLLAQPGDLRLQTPALADLLDDAGDIDAGKVEAAAAALVAARPGMRRATPPTALPGGGMPPPPAPKPTLADVIKRAAGGGRI